jgi:hypothetical protein
MNLFDQPLRAYIRMTAAVAIFGMTPQLATAQTPHPSIREVARKEVTRMAAASSAAIVPHPPNYPQGFRPPMPNTPAGRRAAAITLGAVGGLVAGAMIGAGIGCIHYHYAEECALGGLAGAPIGAAAGAITVVLVTR